MALSVELLKRLNADEEPLPKRLKLAENTFYTNDVPIIRKEDLILQWLCNTCSANQAAWTLLKNCLRTENLDIKVAVKKSLIDKLSEEFQNDIKDVHRDVFECCTLLISNIGIQQYFINKPEDLGLLTKSLLECTYRLLKHVFKIKDQSTEGINISLINDSNSLVFQAYNTTINVLENVVQIFKSSFITKTKFRTMFIHEILYPLCIIIDHSCTDNTNRLGAIAHKCIQQLICDRKYIQNGELLKEEDLTSLRSLLRGLTENARTRNFSHNLMTFTFFFRVAISVFNSNSMLLDMILRELVESLATHKKETLSSLLKCLNDVTFDFDNKIDNITLFDYCQNIINNILTSKSMSNIDFDLLAQFCYFNPLIVERRVQDILKKVFLEKSTLEYKSLMISILNASIHLRQEDKLISTILLALKHCLNQTPAVDVNLFFPNEFENRLIEALNNITNSQTVVMLRTVIYHLKSDCLEMLQSTDSCKAIVMLHTTVSLLIILLDGIHAFEDNNKFVSYKKLIVTFNDLRSTLLLLTKKVYHLNHGERIVGILLRAIYSWNEMQRSLKYYMPKTLSDDLQSPILETDWCQLNKGISNLNNENYQNNVDKLLLQQVKISHHTLQESSMIFCDLNGGLESRWRSILKFNIEVIPFFNNEQMSKLTYLLLEDITSNIDNSYEWVQILHKDELQENRRFMISLLNSILTQTGQLVPGSVTGTFCKHINEEILLKIAIVENEQVNDMLMSIKEELLQNKWTQIQDNVLCKIKLYLEVLLHLPLISLNSNLRLIIFVYTFLLQLECVQNNEIVLICNTIFLDLLERSTIDIFQYVEPSLLLQRLPRNRTVQKTLELFLRNASYATLKDIIKSSTDSNKNMTFLLESLEHIKPKLDANKKIIIKKAQKKLIRVMMKSLSCKITGCDDIKMLNLLLKVNITEENRNEKLKDIIEITVRDIFMNNTHNINSGSELLEDGLQLLVVIVRSKGMFQIANQTIKGAWHTLFQYPCVGVLNPLLESFEPKVLNEFLIELHAQLVKALSNVDENNLKNVCVIWNCILKTDMSNDRNKLRLTAINNLIQTVQTTSIPQKLWLHLIKLIQTVLVAKHSYLPSYIIDTSIFLALKWLQENPRLLFNEILVICNILLKMRTNQIIDKVPLLLVLYRKVFSAAIHESKIIVNKLEEHAFKCFALDIEKYTSSLVKLKKDMTRISPYLIADLMELLLETSTASFVKVALQNCINLLISICDQHGIAFLFRTLPVSMQELFKARLDMYKKFHKFSGKI